MFLIKKNRLLIIFFLLSVFFCSRESGDGWRKLADGFEIGKFRAPQASEIGDSKITVLRIDAKKFDVNLYCASEHHKKLRTVEKWAEEFGLIACINGGMYARDYSTSIGFLKSGDHVNNPVVNKAYNNIFACQPLTKDLPPVKIIDRSRENFKDWKNQYASFLQGIRMIKSGKENVWEQQPKKWSIAALAVDQTGKLLLIHCRSPYSVHDFIENLLHLPLRIEQAMYLEGGPQASLFYSVGPVKEILAGGPKSGLLLRGDADKALQIPNVIGIKKIK